MDSLVQQLATPLSLGSLTLPHRVLYAPLAGCSDFPFRKMSAKYRPALHYCEMVKMEALVRRHPVTLQMLDYSEEMHPIGAQICGSQPALAGQAAKIVEELGFDVVDLNCGCPVDKVTRDGSGSAMLKTPELIGEVLANMVASVKIPVTVKVRMGWDESQLNAAEVVSIAEQAGAKAICIHGRTRKQAYRGAANWEYIRTCKEAARNILVIANGDIVDGPSAEGVIAQTGCDAILVARGTMGRPWIAQEILHYITQGAVLPRTLEECRAALYEHFLWTRQYRQGHRLCVDMRRVGCWYLKKAPGTRKFRERISRVSSEEEIEELILHFPFEEGEEESEEPENNSADACDCD